jgi:hypothetical protein
MAKRSMFVGMDVHKESIDASLAEELQRRENSFDRVPLFALACPREQRGVQRRHDIRQGMLGLIRSNLMPLSPALAFGFPAPPRLRRGLAEARTKLSEQWRTARRSRAANRELVPERVASWHNIRAARPAYASAPARASYAATRPRSVANSYYTEPLQYCQEPKDAR